MKRYIKIMVLKILRSVQIFFAIFPIRNNRIVFSSHSGRQYSCNPQCIYEYMKEHYPNQFEFIWFFRKPDKYRHVVGNGTKIVSYFSLKHVWYEVTAKVSINNNGFFLYPARKGQIFLNTWHGGGCYKKIGIDDKRDGGALVKMNQNATHFLSSSRWFSEHVIYEQILFSKEVLKIGMPRNDIFFTRNEVIRNKLIQEYGLNKESIWILYAPTWRYNGEIVLPDFESLSEAVKKRFGRPVEILYRAHYLSTCIKNKYINVSDYLDIQELLYACDILISDYSSCIWDYSFTYKPCFLFTPDLKQYTQERGFGREIYSWGFPVCRNNQELVGVVLGFEQEEFEQKMRKHHSDLGSYEEGNATEKLCEFIIKEMKHEG